MKLSPRPQHRRPFRRLISVAVLATLPLFLGACEDEETELVGAAQTCLNEMNASMSTAELATKAAECRSILGTPKSEEGFIIQCSSFFLEEGFFGSKILEAFDRADDDNTGSSDMVGLISTFAFSSTENADSAFTACENTGLTTLTVFGSLAKTATAIGSQFTGGLAALLTGGLPSEADIEAALSNIDASDTEAIEDIGESIVAISEVLCSDEDAESDGVGEDVCPTVSGISSELDDDADIGLCVAECIATPKPANCSLGPACP